MYILSICWVMYWCERSELTARSVRLAAENVRINIWRIRTILRRGRITDRRVRRVTNVYVLPPITLYCIRKEARAQSYFFSELDSPGATISAGNTTQISCSHSTDKKYPGRRRRILTPNSEFIYLGAVFLYSHRLVPMVNSPHTRLSSEPRIVGQKRYGPYLSRPAVVAFPMTRYYTISRRYGLAAFPPHYPPPPHTSWWALYCEWPAITPLHFKPSNNYTWWTPKLFQEHQWELIDSSF